MTLAIKPAPVRKSVTVTAPPELAFEVFTRRFNQWWPHTHSIGSSPLKEAVIEPMPGGRWFARLEDGTEADWGHVLAWSPPDRLLLAWSIATDWTYHSELLTEVEVTFTPVGSGTRVDLEHRLLERMGEGSEEARASFDSETGWSGLLKHYVELADRQSEPFQG